MSVKGEIVAIDIGGAIHPYQFTIMILCGALCVVVYAPPGNLLRREGLPGGIHA